MPDRAAGFLRWEREELERFVEYCERFDREMMPAGPGSFRRSGIIALAERTDES